MFIWGSWKLPLNLCWCCFCYCYSCYCYFQFCSPARCYWSHYIKLWSINVNLRLLKLISLLLVLFLLLLLLLLWLWPCFLWLLSCVQYMLIWGSKRLMFCFCGGWWWGCKVIFVSNPTAVLMLCCRWGCDNDDNAYFNCVKIHWVIAVVSSCFF